MANEIRQENEKKQFAILIDSDNISARYVSSIFTELDRYGYASFRRIYGNWSNKSDWTENVLLENSIQPIQQFSYTKGKNATDMAMVIDAMDILYSGKVQGFCIVTSDSDFTRLAMRLREEQMYVIGMGESKTPPALTKACNKFIYLNLINEQEEPEHGKKSVKAEESITSLEEIRSTILSVVEDKEVQLGKIGHTLAEKYNDFDVRNYGYSKLSVLIKEKFSEFVLTQKNQQWCVSRCADTHISLDVIKKEIIEQIKKSGGEIENLSLIYDELCQRHSSFDLKDYGYSRISSFLRSIDEIQVNENKATIKKTSAKKKKK